MTTVSNELDEKYITDAAQDPTEQVWESDGNIAVMQSADDPNDQFNGEGKVPVVRNSGGNLEFLNDLAEVVDNFLEDDEPVKSRKPKLDDIRTRELGSDKWRGRTAQVGVSPTVVVVNSPKRRLVTLVNNGPNIAYISSLNPVAGAPNTFPLQVTSATLYAPLTLPTKDDVYAICAAGESASIGVIEIFDLES